MAHNISWRRGLIGLLLVSMALLLCNLYLLWQLVRFLPELDGDISSAQTVCDDASSQQQIYVPAYSHIYRDGLPVLMEIALSLRNTDPAAGITIGSIDYFDDKGKLLRRYLKQPLLLGPLESSEFVIERADYAGGMGANFLISWSAGTGASTPLSEALMIALENGESVTLVSRGVAVQARIGDLDCGR